MGIRKYTHLFLVALLLIIGLPLFFYTKIHAAELDEASIRLDRMKTDQADTRLMVVIEPSTLTTSRTENILRIVFASGFSVDSTASNITTSTSGLPSTFQGNNLTPMPGLIGSAGSVSGQQANFAINNLSDSTYYGFYITAGIDTPSSIGNYVHTISTRDGSGEIDQEEVGTPIYSNDQISISATVPAKATDGEVSIDADYADGSTLTNDTIVIFTISYKSLLSTSQPFTVEGSWEEGLVEGTVSTYLDVFEYVVGSATDSDGGTSPVVDLQNNTITWNIASLAPSAEYKTVQFQLKATADVDSSTNFTTAVHADGTIISATLAQDTLNYNITIVPVATPTPGPTNTPTPGSTNTPTPGPSNTPTPGPSSTPTPGPAATSTPTPTPTLILKDLVINKVDLREVFDTSSTIFFRTSVDTTYTIYYGLAPTKMDLKAESLTSEKDHIITLNQLTPDSQYFFKITAIDNSGRSITSDVFTFRTASDKEIIDVTVSSLLWKKLIFSTHNSPVSIVPHGKAITLTIQIANGREIDEIKAQLQNARVLGLNNITSPPSIIETKLIEILPNTFSGELLTPSLVGEYNILLKVKDIYGSHYIQRLPQSVFVSEPLTIIDKESQNNIEHARIKIYRYIESKKIYELLEDKFSLPLYSDVYGNLDVILPVGKYRLDISAIGYKAIKYDFELTETSKKYPSIQMQSSFSLVDYFRYYLSSAEDLTIFFKNVTHSISVSSRARDVLFLASWFILLLLVLGSFSLRMHVGIFGLLLLIYDSIKYAYRKALYKHTYHKVFSISESNNYKKYIHGIRVEIKDKKGNFIAKKKSNIIGKITVRLSLFEKVKFPLKIHMSCKRYEDKTIAINKEVFKKELIKLKIKRENPDTRSLIEFLQWIAHQLIVVLSDISVIIGFILALMISRIHGVREGLPFFDS